MHRLLARQLRKLRLDLEKPPTAEAWAEFIQRVDQTYRETDEDRYTLERSLEISADEMQTLYQQVKSSYEAQLLAVVNSIPDLIFLLDEDGTYIDILSASQHTYLFKPAEELIGRTIGEKLPPAQVEPFMAVIRQALQSNELSLIEYILTIQGKRQHFEGRVVATGFQANGKDTVIFLARNISEIVETHEMLEHMASHDELTGLPNRTLCEDHLIQSIARMTRSGHTGALMFFDLDNFKDVNDIHGHSVGDQLLIQVAERLESICRVEDILARFGGDEFVLLLENVGDSTQIHKMAGKVQRAFEQPFQLQNIELNVSTSIGITTFPRSQCGPEELIKQADVAMYAAKESGRNTYHLYSDSMMGSTLARINLDGELRRALAEDQFLLHFQPQYSLPERELTGFEALIRWRHPERGLVLPGQFIPPAELSGLIYKIGLWVFAEACRQMLRWEAQNLPFNRLSLNVSQIQLMHPELLGNILDLLGQTDARNLVGNLEFEITESAIIKQKDIAYENLTALSDLGIQLAIDDFGTGHSSLVNLKRFPLNRLKIDSTFVNDVGRDANDEAIIEATIALADSFNLEVIAEGVENREQERFLIAAGCQQAQGNYYGQPMDAQAATDLLLGLVSSQAG